MTVFITNHHDWTKRGVAPTEQIAQDYRAARDVRLSASERDRATLRVIVATIKIADPDADVSDISTIPGAFERLREASSSPDGRARLTTAFFPEPQWSN